MKLTDREVETFLNYSEIRKSRRVGAWLALAAAFVGYSLVLYFDLDQDSIGLLFGVFVGFSIVELTSQYFRVRPEDKLIDLVQRYINSDPEALAQVLERPARH